MHILHVVGARPNFMKAAPVLRAITNHGPVRQTLIHTGQHYDSSMSEVFFQQLGMPEPNQNLGVGSGTHAQQTAAIMQALESVLYEYRPTLVVVYGDVNSTLAAALVCSKLLIPVAHVEAGLRSRDRTMPEEINRVVTDRLSDLLFTPSEDADENLRQEGIDRSKIHLVGNVMIDSLMRLLPVAEQRSPQDVTSPYVLVTLHRPSNVDDLPWLQELLTTLSEISSQVQIVFPVHPRTRLALDQIRFTSPAHSRLRLVDPLSYLEFIGLERHAVAVITDSGGIQEETTFLGVPCVTVRENTERPITVSLGTNQLVGHDTGKLSSAIRTILREGFEGNSRKDIRASRIPLWDGHAAERIARILVRCSTG